MTRVTRERTVLQICAISRDPFSFSGKGKLDPMRESRTRNAQDAIFHPGSGKLAGPEVSLRPKQLALNVRPRVTTFAGEL